MSGDNCFVLLQKTKQLTLLEKLKKSSIQSDTSRPPANNNRMMSSRIANETHNDGTSLFKVPLSPAQWSFHNISNPVLLKKCDYYRKHLNWAHEKLNVDTLAALYSDLTESVFTYLYDNDHRMPDSTMLNGTNMDMTSMSLNSNCVRGSQFHNEKCSELENRNIQSNFTLQRDRLPSTNMDMTDMSLNSNYVCKSQFHNGKSAELDTRNIQSNLTLQHDRLPNPKDAASNFSLLLDSYIRNNYLNKTKQISSTVSETAKTPSPVLGRENSFSRGIFATEDNYPLSELSENITEKKRKRTNRSVLNKNEIDILHKSVMSNTLNLSKRKPRLSVSVSSLNHSYLDKLNSCRELKNWTIQMQNSNKLEILGQILLPTGRLAKKASAGVVEARINSSMVKTNRGTFILVGPMKNHDDGTPNEVMMQFTNGFPKHWRKVISESRLFG
ncbi:uncharacterized protein LOC142317238 [Lycorma delicatula]|uniref:uncharacterized protein LOC142317238 n=1 Tax=Lycorma delicatula TaxID=130591 RepID=UPI003F510C0B